MPMSCKSLQTAMTTGTDQIATSEWLSEKNIVCGKKIPIQNTAFPPDAPCTCISAFGDSLLPAPSHHLVFLLRKYITRGMFCVFAEAEHSRSCEGQQVRPDGKLRDYTRFAGHPATTWRHCCCVPKPTSMGVVQGWRRDVSCPVSWDTTKKTWGVHCDEYDSEKSPNEPNKLRTGIRTQYCGGSSHPVFRTVALSFSSDLQS